MPRKGDETLQQYLDHYTKKTVSVGLSEISRQHTQGLFGKHATAGKRFRLRLVPKLTGNHSFFEFLYDMLDGKMEGMF